jgi:HAD superfamily hydrolase (TIGR01509 family)
MQLQAVIFDFDGIIVDSEPLHHEAFDRVLEPLGLSIPWEHYYREYLGFDDRDVLRTRFREADRALHDAHMQELMHKKAEAYLAIIREKGAAPFAGVVDFVRRMSDAVPCGISSGALMSDIEPVIEQLGIASCFSEIVTADQVAASKPDPESYRVAFARLKLRYPDRIDRPGQTLAIEDTPAGIVSAKGAGLKVLAVTNSYDREYLLEADGVTDSLENVSRLSLEDMVL